MTNFTKRTALAAAVAALAMGPATPGTTRADGNPLSIDKDGVKTGALQTGDLNVGGDLDVAGDVAAPAFEGKGAVPKGAILMWSGAPQAIPNGWALCDGNNGTPNLSGRFVVGYDKRDADYDKLGNKGGNSKTTLTVAQMPKHSHDGSVEISLPRGAGIGDQADALANKVRNWGGWAKSFKFKTNEIGGSQPFDNRPPYLVLAYIMYLGNVHEAHADFVFWPGQDMTSPNNRYQLSMDTGGTLVLSETGGAKRILWRSPKSGAGYWVMQEDGNLVTYPASGPPAVWSSNTFNNKGAALKLQDDGKLVMYSKDNKPIWSQP